SSEEESGAAVIHGLRIDGEAKRFYPRRELAAPLVGFVAPDGQGKEGLEYSLNSELTGHIEQLRGLRDRSGRLIFAEGISDDQALAGHNLYLSIDQGIQFTAERELHNAATTFEAKGGSAVVVDPNTGELLALASWPFYNASDYPESDPRERRNRSSTDAFEPGSTMKTCTVAPGLDHGERTPTQKRYCEQGRRAVHNVGIRGTPPAEWLSITQVLAHPWNICSAKIGLSVGDQ